MMPIKVRLKTKEQLVNEFGAMYAHERPMINDDMKIFLWSDIIINDDMKIFLGSDIIINDENEFWLYDEQRNIVKGSGYFWAKKWVDFENSPDIKKKTQVHVFRKARQLKKWH